MPQPHAATRRAGAPAPRTARAPGHFWADNEVVDAHLPELGIYAFGVYMLLCRFADSRSGRCAPSIATLARRLGIAELTVKKALQTLVAAGLISVERRQIERDGARQHLSHVYTLLAVAKRGRLAEETAPAPTRQTFVGAAEAASVDQDVIPLDQAAIHLAHEIAGAPEHPLPEPDQTVLRVDHPVIPNKTLESSMASPPPPTPRVAAASSDEGQASTSTANAAAAPAEAAKERTGERLAMLQAMGVSSAKARAALASAPLALLEAWKQVLDDAGLRQALLARGIADPVAFAVAALRDGSGPPDAATLRRWLKPAAASSTSTSSLAPGVRNVSAIPPEEWATMSTSERNAIIAAQAQRAS
jgi:hypothetical protein